MKLNFELSLKKPIGSRNFCKFIIKWLQRDIQNQSNMQKLQIRVDMLPLMDWFSWKSKPQKLSAKHVCQVISQNIEVKKQKSMYIIFLNPYRLFPGTNTPIERIARFLDKGNEVVSGTYFISSILSKYKKSIYKYWRAFQLRSQLPK